MIQISLTNEQLKNIVDQYRDGKPEKGFDLDLAHGKIREEMLRKLLLNGKIEVKTDHRTYDTGNVFIEIESRGKPSGITVSESDWWAFVLEGNCKSDVIIMVHSNRLKNLCKDKKAIWGGEQSRGILISVKELINASYN